MVDTRVALPRDRLKGEVLPYTMKMELCKYPRMLLLWAYQVVKELEKVKRPVGPNDVNIVFLSGITS